MTSCVNLRELVSQLQNRGEEMDNSKPQYILHGCNRYYMQQNYLYCHLVNYKEWVQLLADFNGLCLGVSEIRKALASSNFHRHEEDCTAGCACTEVTRLFTLCTLSACGAGTVYTYDNIIIACACKSQKKRKRTERGADTEH